MVPAPYGLPPVAAPQQNVPPPPYPAVAPDNALTALERALAPKVEPTPAFLELERWVEAHVANVERRRSVLDAAESLEDLKACDAEELEEEEMPEFVACPSSYVTLRNAVLERWHADCCREYTVEQAKHDVPRVFHNPAAQASTVSACGTMCDASSATRPGLGARVRAYCLRACVRTCVRECVYACMCACIIVFLWS